MLTTDASDFELKALLSQEDIRHNRPVSCANTTLTERNISESVTDKELLTIH